MLLVEDDASVASLTNEMLIELGYTVTSVATAQAAPSALAYTQVFGLVLSDVMMPGGMDGLDLAREIRRRQIDLPVVLVSGFAASIKREAEKEGIAVLTKPYSLGDLAAKLHLELSRRGGCGSRASPPLS